MCATEQDRQDGDPCYVTPYSVVNEPRLVRRLASAPVALTRAGRDGLGLRLANSPRARPFTLPLALNGSSTCVAATSSIRGASTTLFPRRRVSPDIWPSARKPQILMSLATERRSLITPQFNAVSAALESTQAPGFAHRSHRRPLDQLLGDVISSLPPFAAETWTCD